MREPVGQFEMAPMGIDTSKLRVLTDAYIANLMQNVDTSMARNNHVDTFKRGQGSGRIFLHRGFADRANSRMTQGDHDIRALFLHIRQISTSCLNNIRRLDAPV